MIVPNRTQVPNNTFAKLVYRYQLFEKSAGNIIKSASVLAQAKETFTRAEFKSFCDAVKLDREASRCRKLLIIGREASRLEPLGHRLPSNWTTLYRLASLEPDKFDRVTKDSRFGPLMTAADLTLIANGPSNTNGGHLSRDLTIDLSAFTNPSTKVEVVNRIRDLQREYGFRLEVSKGLTEQIAMEQSAIKSVPAETARQ